MSKFVNDLRLRLRRGSREEGFTLIELIASLALMSVVLGVIYTSITFGMNTYNKIRIENQLRDEGDFIMSTIITTLYTQGPLKIVQTASNKADKKLVLELTDAKPPDTVSISFRPSGKDSAKLALFVIDELETDSDLQGSSINLVCKDTTKPSCSTGLIDIHLKLSQSYNGKPYVLELDSKFGF